MSAAHRRFLLLEEGVGAAVFNFLLNAVIAWLMFRGVSSVPLWGQQSIAGDTIGTSFILPFLTCLIATPLARKQVRVGRVPALGWTRTSHPMLGWLPARTHLRGVVLGLAGLATFAPAAVLVLGALRVDAMSLGGFVCFKAGFAAFEALVVTPLVALWAIAPSIEAVPGALRASG